MTDSIALAREALRAALQLRRSLSIAREEPVNIYDIAAAVGVEVWFKDLPSLEGMFLREPHPVIILPTSLHRPRGRVAYSCAHELGHYELGHGTRVDEYLEEPPDSRSRSGEELLADVFAASTLMPRQAVLRRFDLRQWKPQTASPLQLFTIAGELGVGYATFARHLRYGLELASQNWLDENLRVRPKQIRESILGDGSGDRLLCVDNHWPQVPIDLEVGDLLAVPRPVKATVSKGLQTVRENATWQFVRAALPGRTDISLDSETRSVRIARRGYCGALRHRHLEDPDVS